MAANTLDRDVGRSFRRADLVIEATDGSDTHYITMDVSFTATQRDRDRAGRNASLITRFTGKPVHPAIAGVRNDSEATEAVESGDVYWHPLEAARRRPSDTDLEWSTRRHPRGLRRLLAHESFFINTFTGGPKGGNVTIAPPTPGDIRDDNLSRRVPPNPTTILHRHRPKGGVDASFQGLH